MRKNLFVLLAIALVALIACQPQQKKEEKKVVKAKVKKNIAIVTDENIPVSTKDCMAIGKFIRGKKIDVAIKELEEVVKIRRAVPMRGEIPHRHGDMMSGRYPKKAAENFIRLLKSLNANATYNGMENPIIFEIVSRSKVKHSKAGIGATKGSKSKSKK